MAVSVAFNDLGSYHRIDLTGSGIITLEQLYQELYTLAGDAETYMTKTGSDPYVYTAKMQSGHNYVQLYVRSGVTFHMDNEDDTLGLEYHATTSSTYTIVYVYGGGTFKVEAGCTIDHNINSSTHHRAYNYFYGRLIVNGTSAKPVTWNEPRTIYVYPQTGDSAQANDVNHFTVNSGTYSSGYNIAWGNRGQQININVPHSYRYIHFSGVNSPNNGIPYWTHADYTNQTFDHITTFDIRDVYINACMNLTITNSKFEQQYNLMNIEGAGTGAPSHPCYNTSKGDRWGTHKTTSQAFIRFKNCEFVDNYNASSTEYGVTIYKGSLAVFEDCTFEGVQDQLSRGIYAANGSIGLMINPTFTNVGTNYYFGSDGTFLHVRKLTLTVQDSGGSPLEGVTVTVRQKEGKEHHTFVTKSDGTIQAADGNLPVFAEMERTANTTTVNWSDGVGNQVHVIEVFKDGYLAHSQEVAFTEDKTILIALSNDNVTPTTATSINNSTLHSSTIY